MRKVALILSVVLLSGGIVMAQDKKAKRAKKETLKSENVQNSLTTAPAMPMGAATPSLPAAATTPSTLTADDMIFTDASHDFGAVAEGPDAGFEFTFKNNGKEPIIVQKAQPSCGCTVPSFSSEPVAPGATGKINVEYHTKGRPGQFTKTITVVSNAGTKVLTIRGNVEKAPTSSVPENTSMIKTN